MQKIKVNDVFDYYVSGSNPKILIQTGTHGDEFEIIEIMKELLEKHESDMPGFVFVPKVSPSAVLAKTRKNIRGLDLNRVFESYPEDPEVKANLDILQGKSFELFISFHEDHEFDNEYYIYDVGRDSQVNNKVLKHNEFLKEHGIGLLNRVDSPEDPLLGYLFTDGYRRFVFDYEKDHGIAGWIMENNIAQEYLMPELPMKAKSEIKKLIAESFIEKVILDR